MKWKGWIGGLLLVMMLFGTLGCGKRRGSVTGGMVDGPGMMYTPEDQSPFAGKWQSRDGTVVMEVESSDPFESSRIQAFVDGEMDFESDMWVYKTAVCIRYSDDSGLKWLTREGAACGEEDVIFSDQPQTPPPAARSCPACHAENEGGCCTSCGMEKPLTCRRCGWQPANEKLPAYCPECGLRLK